MDRSDSTWNEQIRVDSLLRTKIKKRALTVWSGIKTVVCGFFRLLFCKDLWEFLMLLVLLTLVVGMMIGVILLPIMSIRHANEVERERDAEEARLKSNGWICINSSDKVFSELLARKRSDAEFGTNNYLFQATNVVNYRFWYLASPKTNSIERTAQRCQLKN